MTSTIFHRPVRVELLVPAARGKGASWLFLVLPQEVSDLLPSRGRTSVQGSLNGIPFQATLDPDGQGSHWLKVSLKLREAAGVAGGDVVTLEIAPLASEPAPRVPADLRKALAAAPKARALWGKITPIARKDWIHWIVSAKRPETRARRVATACQMLASGKRRVCCFDRSGMFSKSLSRPKEAD